MGRASKQIVIILILLNASAGVITASGLGAAIDINPEIGADEQVQSVDSAADNIEPSQGISDTLFGMFTSTARTVETMFTLVLYGPVMISNAGVPMWLMGFLGAGASVILAADLIHVLTGRDW